MIKKTLLFLSTALCFLISRGQEHLNYQMPPQSIVDLATASFSNVQFSRNGRYMLILKSPDFQSIEAISQPVLGLAGLKVNATSNTLEPENAGSFSEIVVKDLKDNSEHRLTGLPDKILISRITWSPDNTKFAFGNKTLKGVELWLADMSGFSARKLVSNLVNPTTGTPIQWTPSGSTLLVQTIVNGRGNPPQKSLVPDGPVIQQNLGVKTPSRTYEYLLEDRDDEKLMDYYLTSQLCQIDLQGNVNPIYKPAIFRSVDYSPDGNFILAQRIEKPYSYLVPIYYFPNNTFILDKDGNLVKDLNHAPLADKMPIGFDVVAPGPRSYQWRDDVPATLVWAEALDGGKGGDKVEFHDAVFTLAAPFTGQSSKLYSTKLRFNGIDWINNNYAIVRESLRRTRSTVMSLVNPNTGNVVKVISDRSSENRYTDPGRFLFSRDIGNSGVLMADKGKGLRVFTIGTGASPEGDRPFLMRWDLLTGKTDTLFKSQAPFYEQPVFFNNTGVVFFSKESVTEAPNYYSVLLKNKKETALTNFSDPYPGLQGVEKIQLSYPRKDGIKLSGTLYLPKGYKRENGRLPVFVWAYPVEYKTRSAAAEVKGSPYRFPRLNWGSAVYWVTRGYAIVDNADMPIVGTGKDYPNDTFIDQITDNANSLIDYLVNMGVADRNRIAVGGHSYGAFMTANLLAHTNLFAAGIARSGAYNRTLTPFGFQNETRTFWQAPEVYEKMSPFWYADKVKTPLLLIHGIADDNSGTFPIQSERFYSAIKGFGGTVRLVMLPKEFHSYRGYESIMHMLWEQDQWLEKYVKNRKL